MTPFITLEDINSTFLKYGHVNSFHECDTSKLNKTGLYTNITYDFLKISKTSTGFEFQIENNLWSGGYYLLDNDGEYFIPEDATCTWNDDTPTITVTTSEENVTLVLYLTSLYDEFYFEVLKWRPVKLEQYNYTPATANPIHEEILDYLPVAQDIGVRGPSLPVFSEHIVHYPLPVFLAQIDKIKRDTDLTGNHFSNKPVLFPFTVSMKRGRGIMPVLHEEGENVIALPLEQKSGNAGINSS